MGLAVGIRLNYNPNRRDVIAEPSCSSAIVPLEDQLWAAAPSRRDLEEVI